MKLTLLGEDFDFNGMEVDWPTVPREGDFVVFNYTGGVSRLKVDRVEWNAERSGDLWMISVHLSY